VLVVYAYKWAIVIVVARVYKYELESTHSRSHRPCRTCRTTAFRPPASTLGSTCVPPTVNCFQYLATGWLNTYGRRAFSVADPTVWNSLPDFIRDPTISADSFRRLLKTYLFARY